MSDLAFYCFQYALALLLAPLLPGISVLGVLSSVFAFNLSLEKRSHVLLGLLFFSAGM